MPTPIGHALAGAAIAIGALPRRSPPGDGRWRLRLIATCAALAALPDADLLFQQHRTSTHSFLSVAAVIILAAAVTEWVTRSRHSPGQATPALSGGDRRRVWAVALLCGVAWASHILLDWLGADTNTPRGLQMLWPFSDRWFISEWDVFARIERRQPFAADTMTSNVLAVAQEIAIVGAVAVAVWLLRVKSRLLDGPKPEA